MNKRISILLLLTLTAAVSSQSFDIGLKAGVNRSNYSESEDPFYGPLGGLILEYKLNKVWSVQTEFIYSMRGSKNSYQVYDYPDGNEPPTLYNLDVAEKYELHYTDLVMTAKYWFSKKINVSTGFVLGNVISAEQTYNVKDLNTGLSEDFSDTFKERSNTDFGIPVGIQYRFKSGLAFDLQYTFGTLSIYESGDSVKNQTLSLSVAYYF